MALQGSLDDVALVDVLALLSSTRKTGELRIDGTAAGGGRGRLWLLDGLVVAAESSATTGGDAVDVLFELLRLERGTFLFTAGVHATRPGAPREVAPIVEEARQRLEEWRAIEAVVPSVATRVSLVREVPGPSVTVDAASWPVLVAVATGGTVAAAAEVLATGEFGACRAVKVLVDAGLVRVDRDDPRPARPTLDAEPAAGGRRRRARENEPEATTPPTTPPTTTTSPTTTTPAAISAGDPAPVVVEPPASERFAAALREVEGDPVLTAEEVAAAGEAGLIDENGDPINRSLLLKFLSSVRS